MDLIKEYMKSLEEAQARYLKREIDLDEVEELIKEAQRKFLSRYRRENESQ